LITVAARNWRGDLTVCAVLRVYGIELSPLMPRSTPATTAAGLSESLAVGGPPGPELQWGGPSLVQPMAWSQGLCGDCITGTFQRRPRLTAPRASACTAAPSDLLTDSWMRRTVSPGFGYQCSPCCCGTPAAVRKVNRHLAKYGLHPTSNMLCPCCEGCRPRRTNEFGKDDESIMGEVASGSWTCYFFCPPCYIQSNRALFVKQHMLPGMLLDTCVHACLN
jgi:hypothetical protein